MSLLDTLWDDTVAGPRPDTGLGKLRKQSSFGFHSNPVAKGSEAVNASDNTEIRVTRSIMIVKPERSTSDTPPASPAGTSTPPVSPFAGGRLESFRFRRKPRSDAYEKASGIGNWSPRPPYDL